MPVAAVATVEPARLEYVPAPGCFDEETFHHAVASFMDRGRDPFDAGAPTVLRVAFKKVRGGYRGSLQKVPAGGEPWPEEDWTGPTCDSVFREIARLASMRVLGPPKPVQPPPAPAPTVEPPPPVEPPKPPPDPVTLHPPRVPRVSLEEPRSTPPQPPQPPMDLAISLSTALLLTAGFTDDVGPALQIGAGIRNESFSLDLELRGVFPGKVWAREPAIQSKEATSPIAFDLAQLAAQLVPCVRFAKYFAGCGVVGAYTLITQDPNGTEFLPGYSLGPRFGVEVPLGDTFALFGFAEALFAPLGAYQAYEKTRDPKAIPPNVIWNLSIVSGFFGAGAKVSFQ